VNLTTTNYTSYYYSGGRLVAMKQGDDINFMHQDHLSGTALVTNDDGTVNGTMKYFPFGSTRTGAIPTDIKFTGQRLDDTGLYFYNARYYDATIGRFISADRIVQRSAGVNNVSQPLTVNKIPKIGHIKGEFKNHPIDTIYAPENPQSLNRYSYVLNSPLCYIDESGEFAWIPVICIVLIVSYVSTTFLVANYGDNPDPEVIIDSFQEQEPYQGPTFEQGPVRWDWPNRDEPELPLQKHEEVPISTSDMVTIQQPQYNNVQLISAQTSSNDKSTSTSSTNDINIYSPEIRGILYTSRTG